MRSRSHCTIVLLTAVAACSVACLVRTSGHGFHHHRPPAARPAIVAEDPDEPCTPAPEGALVLQEGHRARVVSVAFSPDGSAVASGAEDGSVKVWDATQGALRATLCGVKAEVRTLSFTSDGRSLAASGVVTYVWDMATGARRAALAEPGHYINDFEWNRGGKTITLYRVDTGLELWDAERGARRALLDAKRNTTFAFAPSPRADLVAGAGGEVLRLWHTETGRLLGEIKGPSDFVMSLSWSPDGTKLAAAGKDEKVRVFDLATRKELFSLDDDETLWEMAWSPNGALIASLRADHKVTLWDTRTREVARRLATGPAVYLAWSPQGTELAVSSADRGEVHVWDAATGRMRVAGSSNDTLPRFAWSPDGTTIAIPNDRGVGLWDVRTGQERLRLGAPPTVDASAALEARVMLSPGGSRLLLSDPSGVRWIPMGDSPQAGAGAAAVLPWARGLLLVSPDDATMVLAGRDSISIVDMKAGAPRPSFAWPRQVYASSSGRVRSEEISLHPDGRTLALATNEGWIELHDTETGVITARWRAHKVIDTVSFSPDGAMLVSSGDLGKIRLWDARTRALLRELPSKDGYKITWSGEGRVLAWTEFRPNGRGGLNFGAQLWDMKRSALLRWIPIVSADGIALSPDAGQLLSFDEDGVLAPALWSTATATRQAELLGASDSVGSVAFRPDGAAVAIGGGSGVDLWDTRTFARLASVETASRARPMVAFSRDGGTLIIGGPVLRLYRLADHATLAVHARKIERRIALVVIGPGGVFDADEPVLDSLRVRRGPILGKDPLIGARDAPSLRRPGLLRDFLTGKPMGGAAVMAQGD